MEEFEEKLAQAVMPKSEGLLGAVGLVVDDKGDIIYHHVAGRQSLDDNAQPLDPDCTISLASAGKFITHVAALQLVERGLIGLDEPVCTHIPEIESLPLIRPHNDDFVLVQPTKKITLRHLLLHTSGASDSDVALISRYMESDREKIRHSEDAPTIVKNFSIPLIFEPGEGFAYGWSIRWTQLLIERITGSFLKYMEKNVFKPLGMATSTYLPRDRSDVWDRRLRMVQREGEAEKFVPADDGTQGLTCSIADIAAMFRDMISPSPVLLKKENIDLIFAGQLEPSSVALRQLRSNHENYAFCAGISDKPGGPCVNWSMGGLVVEDDELPVSCLPKGTVTWEGWPNVLWAMNREKGLAMFFATQLVPVGDKVANGFATTFMRDAWKKFG